MSHRRPDVCRGAGQHSHRAVKSERLHHQDQQLDGGGEAEEVPGAQ